VTFVIRPHERESFKRCRRAWDLGARARQNLEPVEGRRAIDVGAAVRSALAVYYFPGMWEWDRDIVHPLAREAYARSMQEQRAALGHDENDFGWQDRFLEGRALLERYFAWAPTVDRFSPVRVETDFSVHLPDPADPERDIVTITGAPLQFDGRIDALVIDPEDKYWMMEHRTVMGAGAWTETDQLLLEERITSFCWAWELFFLGMRIAGVIYNELRLDSLADFGFDDDPREPVPGVVQETTSFACRTRVSRTGQELRAHRTQMTIEGLAMSDPAVAIYPHPTPANCGACDYVAPCLAMSTGTDPTEILASAYRRRPAEELQEGRLGGVTWSIGRGAAPPKFKQKGD
jgi:hypothetical protein